KALLPVLSASLVLYGLQAQYQVHLARRMRFGALATSETLAQVMGLSAGLLAAWNGAGVWSLVYQSLATGGTLLLWRAVATRWLPSWPARGVDLSRFLHFGVNLLAAQILTFVASRIHAFAVGVRLGPNLLGVYDRAQSLVT